MSHSTIFCFNRALRRVVFVCSCVCMSTKLRRLFERAGQRGCFFFQKFVLDWFFSAAHVLCNFSNLLVFAKFAACTCIQVRWHLCHSKLPVFCACSGMCAVWAHVCIAGVMPKLVFCCLMTLRGAHFAVRVLGIV